MKKVILFILFAIVIICIGASLLFYGQFPFENENFFQTFFAFFKFLMSALTCVVIILYAAYLFFANKEE